MKKSIRICFALMAAIALCASCNLGNRNSNADEAEVAVDKCPYPVEVFPTNNGKVELYCINHGSIAVRFVANIAKDTRTILIDPVGDGTTVNYSSIPKADAVLISHDHGDHLHLPTIEARSKNDALLFVNQTAYDKIQKGTVLKNGDKAKISSAITVKAVPAYNTTPDHKDFHPKGVGNGFVLKIDGFMLYVAGDTEPYTKMKNLGNIDVAFLPCNQPYTMTPKQLAKAAKYVGAKVTIPYHMSDTDFDEIRKEMDRTNLNYTLHESLR